MEGEPRGIRCKIECLTNVGLHVTTILKTLTQEDERWFDLGVFERMVFAGYLKYSGAIR